VLWKLSAKKRMACLAEVADSASLSNPVALVQILSKVAKARIKCSRQIDKGLIYCHPLSPFDGEA